MNRDIPAFNWTRTSIGESVGRGCHLNLHRARISLDHRHDERVAGLSVERPGAAEGRRRSRSERGERIRMKSVTHSSTRAARQLS